MTINTLSTLYNDPARAGKLVLAVQLAYPLETSKSYQGGAITRVAKSLQEDPLMVYRWQHRAKNIYIVSPEMAGALNRDKLEPHSSAPFCRKDYVRHAKNGKRPVVLKYKGNILGVLIGESLMKEMLENLPKDHPSDRAQNLSCPAHGDASDAPHPK